MFERLSQQALPVVLSAGFFAAALMAVPLLADGGQMDQQPEPVMKPEVGGVYSDSELNSERGDTGHYWVGPASNSTCHFQDIQESINNIEGLSDDWGTIEVAVAGPNSLHAGNTYEISLDNIENVHTIIIIGGFDDCGGSVSGRTILDAEGVARVFDIANSEGYTGPTREITLRNLDVRGGSTPFAFGGGGVLVNGTPGRLSVHLENTVVQDNYAQVAGGGVRVRVHSERIGSGTMVTADNETIIFENVTAGYGGGISCESLVGNLGTDTLIRWGVGPIAGNAAENGGAVAIQGGCSSAYFYTGAALSGIFGNAASDAGGAFYVSGDGSYLQVRGDDFQGFGNPNWRVDLIGNEADRGGAVYARDQSEAYFYDTNIGGNTAHSSGGGIYANAGEAVVTVGRINNNPCDDSTFGRCSRVAGNSANNGTGGAFLARNDATINVSRTLVEDNSASSRGSVAAVSGAGPGTINLESILATGNHTAPELLYAFHGTINLRFSTMSDNPDSNGARAIGASSTQPAEVGLYSSILWEDSGLVATEGNEEGTIAGDCVIGWQHPDDVDFSITFYRSYYPMFVNPHEGDYRPGPISPAIDFCDDEVTQTSVRDLDGNERGIPHEGSPTQPNPSLGPFDLGAYETDWDELTDQLFQDRFQGGDCTGFCGQQSDAGCFCDDSCFNFGDCCDDICQDCPELSNCSTSSSSDTQWRIGTFLDDDRDAAQSAVRPRRPILEAMTPGT